MFIKSQRRHFRGHRRQQVGAVFVLFALTFVALLGFGALAVDIANLVVARQELRNAADSGALAGARCLYIQENPPQGCPNSGVLPDYKGDVNTNANQAAYDAATSNDSQKQEVDVNWAGGNGPDVERGHWRFAVGNPGEEGYVASEFVPNDSTDPVSLVDVSTAALNLDDDFINAVRVTTRRETPPVARLFSRVFGSAIPAMQPQARAVAYVGFAGTLMPGEVDQPIAICADKLLYNGVYSCSVGRLVPSGGETGGWTSFEQVDAGASCGGGASQQAVQPRICSTGNLDALVYGNSILTNNGQIQNLFVDVTDCWTAATNRITSWELKLPVVDCLQGGTVSQIQPCAPLVGAVTVNVVWIQLGEPNDTPGGGEFNCAVDVDKLNKNAPCQMEDWGGPGSDIYANTNNVARWDSFVTHFNLQIAPGVLATYANGGWQQKTMYLKPSCEPQDPSGTTGGRNFGVLAKIPKLVQ